MQARYIKAESSLTQIRPTSGESWRGRASDAGLDPRQALFVRLLCLKDTRTPLRFAIVRIGLTTVLGYFSAIPLPPMLGIDPKWGVAGLTASAGISGWIEFVLLRRSLGKKIGSDPVGARYLARLWIAAIVASAVAWAIKLQLPPQLHPILTAAAILGPYGAFYLLLAEGGNIRTRIRGLLRRDN